MNPSDRRAIHEAMVRLADGDRAAFDALLDRLWPVILSFAERGVGRGPDAEDIAQEVFFRICSRISDFDRKRDGMSWAFGIASYEVMSHRRRVKRRREVQDDSALGEQPDLDATQEDALLRQEMARVLEQVTETLTDDDRRALGLLPAPASRDASDAALRKRKQRALDRVRGLWRQIYGQS